MIFFSLFSMHIIRFSSNNIDPKITLRKFIELTFYAVDTLNDNFSSFSVIFQSEGKKWQKIENTGLLLTMLLQNPF